MSEEPADAVRVRSEHHEATGWLVETWDLRAKAETIGRVQLYRHRDAWHAWAQTCSRRLRDLGRALATRRNAESLAAFTGLVEERPPARDDSWEACLRRLSLAADPATS